MAGEIELAVVLLGKGHGATGFTRHVIGGKSMPQPAMLRIVKYDDIGFYLFYCDAEGVEYTDTWHESIEGAMAQAAAEFSVKREEWTIAKI